ncbi:MAG: sugar ABC transporter permease [Chloroflexi bacterium]|nr:sugar ABC transporter permease [Chloroflexota bacterium]
MAQQDSVLPSAPQAAAPTRPQHRRPFFSSDNPWFWLAPGLALLILFSIGPLLYNLVASFHEWDIMNRVFEPVGFENWENLLTNADGRIYNALAVTFQYSVIALITQFLLGLGIALLLDEEPWGSGLFSTLLILPIVVAPAIAGMIFRLLEHSDFGAISWFLYQTGLLSPEEPLLGGTGRFALVGLLIVDIWQWTPFFVLILLAGLKGIPHDVLEASSVDGANWFQQFFRIRFPLLRGVLAVAVLFRLIDLFRVFDYVVIMTSGGPGGRTETLSFLGYVNTFTTLEWGYGAALSLFIVILAWVSAYVYQRIFNVRW